MRYEAPNTIEGATALLAGSEDARVLAGGTDLIVQVREQGYSYNDGHLMPGVSAIALPLFDGTTKLVAVLAAMGRPERVNPRDGADMIACLKGETRNFSR